VEFDVATQLSRLGSLKLNPRQGAGGANRFRMQSARATRLSLDGRLRRPRQQSVIKVRAFSVDVENLVDLVRVPSVEELRPASCPGCAGAAHPASGDLGIVGHGTYTRQVRGISPGGWILIHVRRYLCLGCKRTISVLPNSLIPGRWYAAAAILRTLVGALLLSASIADLRATIGPGERSPHWTSPARWARQLGRGLWPWHRAELAGSDGQPREEFLRRLLARSGCHASSPDLDFAARQLAPQAGC